MTATIELGTQTDGSIVYREARRKAFPYIWEMNYTVKMVDADKLDDMENLPFHAWPGGYEMAYYVVSDSHTDGPYCATCAHEMARSGNYYGWDEDSSGLYAECTDGWNCPNNCAHCDHEIGPSMHCGPRNADGDCGQCGAPLEKGEETAL